MTVYTKTAHLAGKTTVTATVHILHPLDDPKAEGNMGLEGFDDEWVGRDFPNVGLAKAWAERYEPTHPARLGGSAQVKVYKWEEDRIADAEYGVVVDAASDVVEMFEGWTTETGWEWAQVGLVP